MPARTSKSRLVERKFAFRRSSEGDANVSASYHRDATTANHPRSFAGRKSSFLRMSLRSSSISSADTPEHIPDIDSATQAVAIRTAEEKKENFRASLPRSLIQAHDARDCVAPFRKDEIVFGPKLGSGEFSHVYEVNSFQFDPYHAQLSSFDADELNGRLSMKKYEKYRETKNARYAVKHIKEDYHYNHDSDAYIQAASDLALEAEFLASLQHPNIIKLRGIVYSGADGFSDGPSGYFLIIDRLFETLDQRMRRWRHPNPRERRMRSFRRSITALPIVARTGNKESSKVQADKNKNKMMDERLSVAFQISAAMVYLHKHSIMFRDLKPTNIGFDVRGDVKIFDFGLARIMPKNGDPNNDLFEMSGAGSPRYMAPECLSGNPYNMKADVYTFAIIVWEILSGKTPYVFVRNRQQLTKFILENGRPVIDETWPSSIQGMLQSSFDSEVDKRPKMTLWYNIIRETLASLRGGDRSGLNDTWVKRRRSIESMRDITRGL